MRTETVIVGAGLAGSAAAWALTRMGRPCVLLEAFQPGHDRGSSHGSARIFRRAYPDPLYVRLTGQARRLWTELEDEAGQTLITVTGALDFGPSSQPGEMYELLAAHGVAAEMVHPREAASRWPGFAFADGDRVMFHPDGGVIDAERAMTAMRDLAAGRGAEIRYGTPVRSVEPDGTVRTDDVTYQADTVIVAAGAWLEPLAGRHVKLPELTVTQVTAGHFAPQARGEQSASAAPGEQAAWPTFIYADDEAARYGLLSGADAPGAIKVGVHGMGTVTTGDDRDGIPDSAVMAEVRRFVRTRVPGVQPESAKEVSCLYTGTPSEDFVIDRLGALVIVSACSGHGAKFAPLTGVFAANLATGAGRPEARFALPAQ
jgi:monomeric sarcosine oxidase